MKAHDYNYDCPTCRQLLRNRADTVTVERCRPGGEFRVKADGRTLAHAKRVMDATILAAALKAYYRKGR